MRDRGLYKTNIGQYDPAVWTGKNEAGCNPVGDRILVKPDKAATKTAGGIVITDKSEESITAAAEAGIIVAMGTVAFAYADRERTTPWHGDRPKVGDRVAFQRYSGLHFTGDDGEMYRSMNDYCIAAIYQEPTEVIPEMKLPKGVVDAMRQAARANGRS